MKVYFLFILTILYPVATHIAIIFNMPQLVLIYLAIMLILYTATPLYKVSMLLVITMILSTLILLAALLYGNFINIILLPPIVVSFSAFLMFSRSLLKDRVPLITFFAKAMYKKDLPDNLLVYTKHCTIFWSIITGLIVIETIFLALFAPIYIWSLFCNILNDIFIALFFIVEYIYRILRFGRFMSVKDYMIGLFQIKWREAKK